MKHPVSALPLWIEMAKWDFGGGDLRRCERSWPEKVCPL